MNSNSNNPQIKSFRDLRVYQNTYQAMLIVMKEITPKLPDSEKFDLRDQLSRSCKAIPRLIAEGYGKRHQKAGFQKYLDDAMGESNETIVSLEQCRDIYAIEKELINKLVDTYDMASRQLYKLTIAWSTFKRPLTKPSDDTSIITD
ncbi:MAG: four helix bundle protein [Candidatus Levybacteria bacterium]|nr:four helix bundle protein [Candidatus Levybacteria bacterium]